MATIKAKEFIEKSTEFVNRIKETEDNAVALEAIRTANRIALDLLNELETRINNLL